VSDAPEKPLTAKQRAFVAAYVGEAMGNATQAARLAGYKGSDKTLCEIGRENLEKPGIASALQVFRMATAKKALKSAEDIAEWLCGVIDGTVMEKRVEGGKDDFVEYEASAPVKARIDAAALYLKARGMMAPTKSEVTVQPTSPEVEKALIAYLRMPPEERAAFKAWQEAQR
jgi:phage terminase small subunit